ncbi:ComEC/Rec2 family competence protein [Tenacibaculum sp. IB213877]|uniref:ComEC/Rec2 family competence protein n=1 Tax=Tenacibaculum sp. IB213877 TaxID=3097351 RepID=UPI002A5A5561|nr:ComEC/Rec2 family competence protein [Tenacibaculum sp. IB213877]MDY0780695.1 ComEC/Rec2 family competence protein [Tenacibaculum sp. IB213877]
MKKLINYLPSHFLLCTIVGICIQFYTKLWQFGFVSLFLLLAGFLLLLVVFHNYKKKTLFIITTSLLFIFVGISSVYIHNSKNYNNHYSKHLNTNEVVVLTINTILKPGNYYDKYKAEVSQINTTKTNGEILLNIQKDSFINNLKVDDKLLLQPTFKELIPPLNPHQFDYKNYLAKQGIEHQVFVDNSQFKIVDKRTFSLVGLSAMVREKIQQSLAKYNFSKDEFAVINALLLGQRQEISKELLKDYTNAGAIHILAISGLHIGILLLLLTYLLQPVENLPKGKLIKTFLIVLLLWMFAFIAGLSASVVRAVTMFTFVAIGQSFNSKQSVEYSLVTSMFFILLVNPMFLFDVGFQLSYLAVFGIVWVQPLLYNIWKPKLWFLNKCWQLLTVSVAAQAGILPISLYYFHQFPSLFILSNLAIIPFLGAILVGGITVIVLALVGLLPQFLASAYGIVINMMNSFVGWISSKEDFLFTHISMSVWLMIALYVVIILTFRFIIKRTAKRFLYVLAAVLLVQSVYIAEKYVRNIKQEFIVFHKSRQSVIGNRNGENLQIYHDLDSVKIKNEKLLTSYVIGENILPKLNTDKPAIFTHNNSYILFIDSLGVYPKTLENPTVVLQYSPKLNLNRLINDVKPKIIITDGTNFKSYIERWKLTCEQQKTPFHYTGQNGAFSIK